MLVLKATPRQELGKKVNKFRKAGQIPAVIYGHGIKSQPLFVVAKDFEKVYKEAGESTLIALEIDGKKRNVLIHDLARDPLKGQILHIDFYEVRMDEKVKAHIPLVFIGEAPVVKTEGGILIKNIQEVEVEAKALDLPHQIEVDISGLKTFDDNIYIKDLKISNQIKILAEPDEVVASVIPSRKEEEIKPEAAPTEAPKEAEKEEVPPTTS